MIDRLRHEDSSERTPPATPVALLAHAVAQEFNNILQVIGTRSEILLARFEASDPRRENVVEIRNAVHRGAELTRELLELGRAGEPGSGPRAPEDDSA